MSLRVQCNRKWRPPVWLDAIGATVRAGSGGFLGVWRGEVAQFKEE
jgi:hypothetical protein